MRTKITAFFLIGIGVVALGISVWLYMSRPSPPKLTSDVAVATAPSSVEPSARSVAGYSVLPDLPKYIKIPAIHVTQTRIIGLGRMADGRIATPDNIYDAGWYENSSKPGQAGAMFIFGHVSSWKAKGAFYDLKKLVPGQTITIIRGDGAKYTYTVVTTKIYPYDHVDMKQVLAPINPGKPGLNLMTCTGNIIKGTSDFDERLAVFASLVAN